MVDYRLVALELYDLLKMTPNLPIHGGKLDEDMVEGWDKGCGDYRKELKNYIKEKEQSPNLQALIKEIEEDKE